MKLFIRLALLLAVSIIYVVILHMISFKILFLPIWRNSESNEERKSVFEVVDQHSHREWSATPRLPITCKNIESIQIEKKLGSGNFKTTFLGIYRDMMVAVKVVMADQLYTTTCLAEMDSCKSEIGYRIQRCHGIPNMKLMKEIILMEELIHPNLMKLLGFCVRSQVIAPISDVFGSGILGVYEYGENIKREFLISASWSESMRHATELANLLNYLEQSPLGSLRNPDVKYSQFCIADKKIKMSDVDGFVYEEPRCDSESEIKTCPYGVECKINKCIGSNAKSLLERFRDIFFLYLFASKDFPADILPSIKRINDSLNVLSINASELEIQLKDLNTIVSKT